MTHPTRSLVAAAALLLSTAALGQESAEASARPEGSAVGIGIGYSFPSSVLEPNTASARFRVGPVTLEPRISARGSSTGVEQVDFTQIGDLVDETTMDTTGGGFSVGVGTDARFPLASKGPLDLLFIGGIGFDYSNLGTEVSRSDTNVVSETSGSGMSVGLRWGLGIEWFLGRGFSLSADATNPLVGWSRVTALTETSRPAEDPQPAAVNRNEETRSGFDFGLTFQPTIRAMIHLYF